MMKIEFKQHIIMNTKYLLFIVVLLFSTMSSNSQTLREAFKDHYLIGVAVNRSQINQTNEEESKLIASQFSSLTAENDMKWMHIHPEKDRYNFEVADKLVDFAEQNNMFVVGHTLVWHSQLARWVFKDDKGDTIHKEELYNRIEDHINTIVGRYKGKVQGWDVVNEALNDDGSYRESSFYKIAGEEFITKAFQYAAEADPEAELYYNDYNLIEPVKRDGAIKIVKSLKDKGVKIDGVGVQAHWSLNGPSIEEIEKAIEMYAAAGVKVMFTELDITVLPSPWSMPTAEISTRFENSEEMNPYPDKLPDSVETQLAQRYADIFKLFNKHADKVSRVTLWGLHDGLSWKNNFPIRGRTDYTLLFNRQMEPKKAYHSVINTVKED